MSPFDEAQGQKLSDKRCIPCEGDVDPLTEAQAEELKKQLHEEWSLVDGGGLLARSFHFPNFKKTMEFVNKVAAIAEEEQHHPDMTVSYGDVGIELMTHAIGGLSENDFILAAKIDEIQ
ncbi:MAG TPA: 4a-hydroxytetrahydrobiopterin dehydratase [Candidatus Paceibacterota bacterium]|nr:4a-hydroxytetrahydrobiopterin dehydratase [Candidatus Paceibacterota bacterium]